jgi:hypothetical protein
MQVGETSTFKLFCFGIWDLIFGTWNLELGTWNLELGTWNFKNKKGKLPPTLFKIKFDKKITSHPSILRQRLK